MNHPVYLERQWIKALWIILSLVTVLVVSVLLAGGKIGRVDKSTLTVGIALVTTTNLLLFLLLGCLTICIDATHLRWQFGLLGWPAWKLPLTEITTAEATTSRWVEGWGIRFTSQGMLYNAAGCQAVCIHKRDGSSVRLGTTDSQRLLSFLLPRLSS